MDVRSSSQLPSSSLRAKASFLGALLLAPALATGCLRLPEETAAPLAETAGTITTPSTAQDLLDRYVQSLGGLEAIQAIKSRSLEAEVTFNLGQVCKPEDVNCIPDGTTGSYELQTTEAGKMHRKLQIQHIIDERGFNGKASWRIQPFPRRIVVDDPRAYSAMREDSMLHWYLDPASRSITPQLVPARTIQADARTITLDGLEWKTNDPKILLPNRTLWFDRETGLLYEQVETEQISETATIENTTTYHDYKEVDGIKIAFLFEEKSTQADKVGRINYKVTSIQHNAVLEPTVSIPTVQDPAPLHDPWLQALAQAQKAAAEAPQDPTAQIGLARAAWAAGHFPQAEQFAQATLAVNPKEPEAIWIMAQLGSFKGDYKSTERWLKKASKAGISDQMVESLRASVAIQNRDYKKAVKHLKTAGAQPLADRYKAFRGKPYALDSRAGCTVTMNMLPGQPAPIVEVMVENDKLLFAIDTSASDLMLSERAAAKLILMSDAQTQLGPQGPIVKHAQIDSLKLGNSTVKNVPVDIYPEQVFASMTSGMTVDGVLGNAVFHDGILSFDNTAATISFTPDTRACKSQVEAVRQTPALQLWMNHSHALYMTAQLRNSEGIYVLNTGMRGAAFSATEGAFARAGIAAPPHVPGTAALKNIDRITLSNGLTFENVVGAYGYLTQSKTADNFRFDGMLGAQLFGNTTWSIDFPKRQLHIGPSK